jgi:hypothetical protein
MKVISFITSVTGFIATAIFLMLDFPVLDEFGGVIYFGLFIVLMLIFLTGIIVNRPGKKYPMA